MWFLLGIVSFTGLLAYRLWRKFHWSWGWTRNEGYLRHAGRPYKSRQSENKGVHRFSYAVRCPATFYFRIKRETRWDRWAKRIGLAVERQFSDAAFDELLYVASDNPAWQAELSQVPELRRVLIALFKDPNLQAITCEGRHLWADIRLRSEQTPMQYVNGPAAWGIVAALHGVADSLTEIDKGFGSKDTFAFRAVVLVSLASAMLLLGMSEGFRLFFLERGDLMIDSKGLFQFSAALGGLILVVWLVVAIAWMRGSSHAHLVLGEILVSGGIGLLGAGYALARDINCEWDNAAATPHVLTVANKYTGYRRKYGTYYQIRFDPALPGMSSSIEVDWKTYSLASVGKPLAVYVRPGRLGYRWIEGIRQTEADADAAFRTASPRY